MTTATERRTEVDEAPIAYAWSSAPPEKAKATAKPTSIAATSTDGHLSRAAARGAAIGFVVATATSFAMSLLQGFSAGTSLAIGVFVGIWGGVGFGGMFGAVLALTQEDLDG